MALTEEDGNIPYDNLAQDFFLSDRQHRIPFLGAGVSISALDPPKESPVRPADPRIEKALACLRDTTNPAGDATPPLPAFSADSLFFLQMAIEMALGLETARKPGSGDNLLARLRKEEFPPSSGELLQLFRAGLPPFESVAQKLSRRLGYPETDRQTEKRIRDILSLVAGLARVSSPSLSTMCAYFEHIESRTEVLRNLADIFENKVHPTPTHCLLARIAARHLQANRCHFLIITTNYDCLMERALEDRADKPPFVVLSANHGNFQVHARFGNMPDSVRQRFEARNPDAAPNRFGLDLPEPVGDETEFSMKGLVVVYKLHGCIHQAMRCPRLEKNPAINDSANCLHDGIVLSDEDYILSIARLAHNDGAIPAVVGNLMRFQPILFLGYSLSDWNVRGLLKALRDKVAGKTDKKDYTVVRDVNTLEELLCTKNKIIVIRTTLNTFSANLGAKGDSLGSPG